MNPRGRKIISPRTISPHDTKMEASNITLSQAEVKSHPESCIQIARKYILKKKQTIKPTTYVIKNKRTERLKSKSMVLKGKCVSYDIFMYNRCIETSIVQQHYRDDILATRTENFHLEADNEINGIP